MYHNDFVFIICFIVNLQKCLKYTKPIEIIGYPLIKEEMAITAKHLQHLHLSIFNIGSRKPIFECVDYFFEINPTTVCSFVTWFRVQTRKSDVIIRRWRLRHTFSRKTVTYCTLQKETDLVTCRQQVDTDLSTGFKTTC